MIIKRILKYIGTLGWKPVTTLARYYIDKDHTRWCHNTRGVILEVGAGRIRGNIRCRNAKTILSPDPRDDMCIVYGRNVRDCDDCAFKQRFL